MSEPSPIRGFFGALLMAAGVLLMVLCGGCGALFFVGFLISGLFSSNSGDVGMVILPILFGGVPAAVRFGLFSLGRGLRKPSS